MTLITAAQAIALGKSTYDSDHADLNRSIVRGLLHGYCSFDYAMQPVEKAIRWREEVLSAGWIVYEVQKTECSGLLSYWFLVPDSLDSFELEEPFRFDMELLNILNASGWQLQEQGDCIKVKRIRR